MSVRRQLPDVAALRGLLRLSTISVSADARAAAAAANIADLRRIARRRTPTAVFDYVDGAAEDEVSISRSRSLFRRTEFAPRVLVDVAEPVTSTTVLGRQLPAPLILAPTGFTRMVHYQGEHAVASAAAARSIPYVLSTMGTVSLEDLLADHRDLNAWFQLYLMKDRGGSVELIDRAHGAGYETLVVTVDTPVGGRRLRDVRNGLTIPPTLSWSTVAQLAAHPRWWANLLTTAPLEFASLRSFRGTVAELVDTLFDPSMTPDDIAWLRSLWPGQLVVKGVLHPDDARLVVAAGADAVVVSNHGGRQLDRAVAPLLVLPEVAAAVRDINPEAQVLLDGGITDGADVVAACAYGADACLVGRAYLYGLMAAGQRGVGRAIDILTDGMTRTLQLLGVANLADLGPDHVRVPAPTTQPKEQ